MTTAVQGWGRKGKFNENYSIQGWGISGTGWARQERVSLVERRVWRAVVLWWRAIARWTARGMGCFGFETACLQTQRVKSCSRRRAAVWAQKRDEIGETPTFVWRSGHTCRAKM